MSSESYDPQKVKAAITNSARPPSALRAHSSATGRGIADALGTVNLELGSIDLSTDEGDEKVAYGALAIGVATPIAIRLIQSRIGR